MASAPGWSPVGRFELPTWISQQRDDAMWSQGRSTISYLYGRTVCFRPPKYAPCMSEMSG